MAVRKTKVVEVEKKPVKRPALTPAFIGGIFGSLVVIVIGTVMIGKSDTGQINVNAAIQTSNQANIDAGGDPANNVNLVREDLRNMRNGGLVPQENQPETPAPEAPQTEQGTTTESTDTASTTPDTSEEGEETGSSTPPESAEGTDAVTNAQ